MEKFIWISMMDIPPDKEDLFNRIYSEEHLPEIAKVPGVLGFRRYVRVEGRTEIPKYAAIIDMTSPDLVHSPEWRTASDRGEWKPKIRAHTFNRILGSFRQIA
jgi:hypothetical protein